MGGTLTPVETACATDAFAVPTKERPERREYTVRITKELRETLNALAQKYNLYTVTGTPRDAEIARVLLVCALTEEWPPHEQAAVALYVNGLMLVAQGLWLGLGDIRTDLAETMRVPQLERVEPEPPQRDRERLHIRVNGWIRQQIALKAAASGFVREDGTLRDSALVSAMVQRAVAQPEIYWRAFVAYARGIAQVRAGLTGGLMMIRDALCAAVATVGE